jgi:hypothetical protein
MENTRYRALQLPGNAGALLDRFIQKDTCQRCNE